MYRSLFSLFASALLTSPIPAATVVSDTFNGTAGETLSGTEPDTGPPNWVGNAGFQFVSGGGVTNANASQSGGNGEMASVDLGANYMALNIGVHTLTMSVTTSAETSDVMGFGFGTVQGTDRNQSYANSGFYGTPWLFLRANGEAQVRSNSSSALESQEFGISTSARLLLLSIDNTQAVWTIDASVDGVAFALNGGDEGTTYSYQNNPTTISNVGISVTETDSVGKMENFVYDFEAVPEPSAAYLGALGALLLLRRRK